MIWKHQKLHNWIIEDYEGFVIHVKTDPKYHVRVTDVDGKKLKEFKSGHVTDMVRKAEAWIKPQLPEPEPELIKPVKEKDPFKGVKELSKETH